MADEDGEESGEDPGDEADDGGAAEVEQVERRLAGDREDGFGAGDGGEHDVAGRRADRGGQQHPPGQVFLVGDLEGEHDAGDGRLEDGGDPGGGTGDEEHLGVAGPEVPGESSLERRADRGAGVQGRAFVAEGAAGAEGGDRREHAGGHRSEVEPPARLVEVADVLVRGGGTGAAPGEAEAQRGEHEADAGRRDLDRQGKAQDGLEEHVRGETFEPGHDEAGDGAGETGEQEHLPGAVGQVDEAGAAIPDELRKPPRPSGHVGRSQPKGSSTVAASDASAKACRARTSTSASVSSMRATARSRSRRRDWVTRSTRRRPAAARSRSV